MAGNGRQKAGTLILALAAGASVRAAAERAGISERTAHRHLKDPEFRREVLTQRARMLERATGRLAAAATKAVKTLNSLMGSNNDAVRLGAAKSVLESSRAMQQSVDLEARLAAMEAKLKAMEQQPPTSTDRSP